MARPPGEQAPGALDSPPLLCYTLPAFLAGAGGAERAGCCSLVPQVTGLTTSHSPADGAGGVPGRGFRRR
jgi:hypothetical protein